MSQPITLERIGQRVYIVGNTFPVKDQLKKAGCHWDGERRQWWIGAAKAAAIEAIVAAPAAPAEESGDDVRLIGKAMYKGRTYYVRALSGDRTRARLISLDGRIDFWATVGPAEDQAQVVKTYAPRERTYRGRTTRTYTTLGSIRRFLEQEAANRKAGGPVCAACGKSGDLVEDLEDGLLKHRWCCDIEP